MNKVKSAIITINRPYNFTYALRAYNVFIDDVKVGKVKNSHEENFEVQPGRHSVYVKIDFYKSRSVEIDLQPKEAVTLICGIKEGINGFIKGFTARDDYLQLKLEEGSPPDKSYLKSIEHDQIRVHLESGAERITAVTEEVHVPLGVKIIVKRSRTIEHSVEVDWSITGEGRLDIGIKQILSGSIRSEITKKQGQSYKESETMEYEIELNGKTSNRFKLVWTDIWRKGTAQFSYKGMTNFAPFRFKEHTELEVVPLMQGSTS